jgi:hypothetical protein
MLGCPADIIGVGRKLVPATWERFTNAFIIVFSQPWREQRRVLGQAIPIPDR